MIRIVRKCSRRSAAWAASTRTSAFDKSSFCTVDVTTLRRDLSSSIRVFNQAASSWSDKKMPAISPVFSTFREGTESSFKNSLFSFSPSLKASNTFAISPTGLSLLACNIQRRSASSISSLASAFSVDLNSFSRKLKLFIFCSIASSLCCKASSRFSRASFRDGSSFSSSVSRASSSSTRCASANSRSSRSSSLSLKEICERRKNAQRKFRARRKSESTQTFLKMVKSKEEEVQIT